MLSLTTFLQPESLTQALEMLGPGVAPVAGGTDFCVNPRFQAGIHTAMDIRRCQLAWIRDEGAHISIGATSTMLDVTQSTLVRQLGNGIVATAAATCGSPNVRNVATIGGNAASALPSADTPATLIALDAVAIVAGTAGRRTVPLDEFFTGPGRNILNNELLVEFRIPVTGTYGAFQKLGRAADDISIVNSAVAFNLEEGEFRNVRVVVGAVAPTPLRCRRAEALLEGRRPRTELIEEAATLASSEVSPITDQRASADYRRRTTRVLIRRALEEACASISS